MEKFFHLFTSLANGIRLQVLHAPLPTDVAGADLDTEAASRGLSERLPDETDAAFRTRIHATGTLHEVEVKPGMPNRVPASFWLRWLELNPDSSLVTDHAVTASEAPEVDDSAEAVAGRRAEIATASGANLDHFAGYHGVEARRPGEPDAGLRARLLAVHPEPEPAEPEVAAESVAEPEPEPKAL